MEATMNANEAKTFTIAAVTLLALGLAPAAKADDKGCTNASLNGTFSQKGSGVITAPPSIAGPMANVGTLTFDGRGAVTGALVNNLNGTIASSQGHRLGLAPLCDKRIILLKVASFF
jgi:hypothetical protein